MRSRQSIVSGVFILGFVALLGVSFLYVHSAPTFGIGATWVPERGRYEITSVPPSSPLKPGDTLLGIGSLNADFLLLLMDNIHIRDRRELFTWFDAKARLYETLKHPPVLFTVERGKETLRFSILPGPPGLAFLGKLEILHVLAGILFFLIGTIVFHKQRGSEQGIVFFALCVGLSLVFVTNATSLMGELALQPAFFRWINIVNIAALLLGNATLLHFSLLLPRKRAFLGQFPVLAPLFHAGNAVLAVSLSIREINFVLALYGPLAAAAVVQAWITYHGPIERQQMKWVGAGFVFGLAPWIFINAIPMLITGERLMKDTVPAAFVVCIPLSMAFAIQKYRLLDIDAFLEGTFVTLVTVLLLGIADLTLMGLLTARLINAPVFAPAIGGFITIALVVSCYAALRERVQRLLRRIFRRDRPREADILASFADETAGLPPNAIVTTLAGTIGTLFRPREVLILGGSDAPAPELLASFHGETEPVNLWERTVTPPAPSDDLVLGLPVGKGPEVHRLILLGALPGGRLYTRLDWTILKALLTQARMTYENALLYEENLRHHRARLEEERNHAREKEKILKELHDGIGGITTSISLLADLARERETVAEMKESLATISSLSRESLAEIRSFMQSLDPREATWEALVGELRYSGGTLIRSHGMRFEMREEVEPPGEEPGSLLFLNAFRVYKEALVNVVKHAEAGAVRVTLTLAPDSFVLRVEDNGRGFDGRAGGPAGRGIRNMKARAGEVGGGLEMDSNGAGTRVELRVPLPVKYPERVMESARAG